MREINEQRLFYEKLKKEELIDIILEFEDSDKKDAEIYEYQNSKIKKLQKENENLKEQLNKADKELKLWTCRLGKKQRLIN